MARTISYGWVLSLWILLALPAGSEEAVPAGTDTSRQVTVVPLAAPDTAAAASAPAVGTRIDTARTPGAPLAPVGSEVTGKKADEKPKGTGMGLKDTASRLGDVFSPGKILAAAVVLLIAYLAIRITAFVLGLVAERMGQYRLKLMKLVPIIRIFTWITAIYLIIVDIFSPSMNALVAFTASAGIAIGFASQDILKNIFGGILIIMDRPFQVGDKIQVGSHYGEVVSIGLRTVRIVTPDDSLVSVPNSELVNQSVSNANAGALDCQVSVEFRLPPDVDLLMAKKIVYEAAATSRFIYLRKPIAVVVQDEFREWFLTKLKVKAYVLDARYEFAFASDVTETAKQAFAEAGIYLTKPVEEESTCNFSSAVAPVQ